MKKWALLTLLLLAMGCWSSDGEQTSATGRPDAAPRDATTSPAMWEWPARAGEPRDLARDHAECLREADAQSTPRMRTGVLWDCMRRKGWHRIKERYRFDWEALRSAWIWGGEPSTKRDLAADERACNEPAVVRDAPPAELERYFACMAGKGWRRNELVWKKRLSAQ